MPATFYITGDEEADRLLAEDPLALLIGMLLDQQVPMEWAFMGPYRLKERLGGLDVGEIANMDPDDLEDVFRERPALHRFPSSMAKRTHKLARHIVEEYDAKPETIWTTADSGEELLKRLKKLPGYGEEKSKIFLAILGKRFDIAPEGWKEAGAPFSDDTPRSVADIESEEALEQVREWKRAQKGKKDA